MAEARFGASSLNAGGHRSVPPGAGRGGQIHQRRVRGWRQLHFAKERTYDCFKEWAEDAGEHNTMTQVEFNEKMLCKFAEGRSNIERFWKGFTLRRYESDSESRFAAQEMGSLDFDPRLSYFKRERNLQ